MELSKTEKAELRNIGVYQPVFAGDTLSHETARSLCDKGLALHYNDEPSGYCLTEAGKILFAESFPGTRIGSSISRSYKRT